MRHGFAFSIRGMMTIQDSYSKGKQIPKCRPKYSVQTEAFSLFKCNLKQANLSLNILWNEATTCALICLKVFGCLTMVVKHQRSAIRIQSMAICKHLFTGRCVCWKDENGVKDARKYTVRIKEKELLKLFELKVNSFVHLPRCLCLLTYRFY